MEKEVDKNAKTEVSVAKTSEGISPAIVAIILLVAILLIGIVGYFVFVNGSEDSKEYELVEDFQLYEGNDYRIQYPSEWEVQDGSTPMFFNSKYVDAGEFNPNLNVVTIKQDLGDINQSACDELAKGVEEQYAAYIENPKVTSSEIVDIKYHDNVCKVTAIGDITLYDDVYGLKLSQILLSKDGTLFVLSYGYEEETEIELETLESMANTFKVGSY